MIDKYFDKNRIMIENNIKYVVKPEDRDADSLADQYPDGANNCLAMILNNDIIKDEIANQEISTGRQNTRGNYIKFFLNLAKKANVLIESNILKKAMQRCDNMKHENGKKVYKPLIQQYIKENNITL